MDTSNPSRLDRMDQRNRRRLVWPLLFITWIGLIAGLIDPHWFPAVVGFSAASRAFVSSVWPAASRSRACLADHRPIQRRSAAESTSAR